MQQLVSSNGLAERAVHTLKDGLCKVRRFRIEAVQVVFTETPKMASYILLNRCKLQITSRNVTKMATRVRLVSHVHSVVQLSNVTRMQPN